MNALGTYRGLCTVLLFGAVYFLVGFAFPNPPASNPNQFVWRLAAWLICAFAFAIHIGLEHCRQRDSSRRIAIRAAAAVALAAFCLAAAANIHALKAGTGNQRLLLLALVIWPIAAGLPAFAVGWVAAAGLARVRSNGGSSRR